jgi:signal transduction histidine kinase
VSNEIKKRKGGIIILSVTSLKKLHALPIRQRFMGSVLLLVTGIMLVFGVFRIKTAMDISKEELSTKIKTMGSLAAMAFSNPLWNYNYDGMTAIGNALLQDREIGIITVKLADGSQVYHQAKSAYPYNRDDLIFTHAAILHNNAYLGTVTVGVSKYYREEIIRQEVLMTTMALVIMAAFLALIINWLSLLVTKPLSELSAGVDEFAKGNLENRLEIDAGGEIGELARRFNSMAENLLQMMKERDNWSQALQQANDELEIKVEFRTQELTALNQELIATNQELQNTLQELKETQAYLIRSEKMAALGSLVAGVAHEINTPMGMGVTLASHLEQVCREFSEKYEQGEAKRQDLAEFLQESAEAAKMILNNLQRAIRLIGSLKQVSADQSVEEKRNFNIAEYLGEIMVSLQPKLKTTKVAVEIRCGEKLEMNSYPGALYQIISNLIMNSLLHAYNQNEPGKIRIQAENIGDEILLEYADDGKGMAAEVQNRIFEPFFTTKRGAGGTGLGLYIVYNIVTQQFGGTVECFSEPEKGTRFQMKIPVGPPDKIQP